MLCPLNVRPTPLHWITSHAELGEAGLGEVGIAGEVGIGKADRNLESIGITYTGSSTGE
jgi:hypothetical protein